MTKYISKLTLYSLAILFFFFSLLFTATSADSSQGHSVLTATFELLHLPIVLRQATPTLVPTPTSTPIGVTPWLEYVNQFRTQANLPPLIENSDWSYGDWLHSRYVVKNDYPGHDEDPSNPWYTPEGAVAGASGNVMATEWKEAPDEYAIDEWMTAPFHGICIIDPELQTTGFGSYRDAVGLYQMGATLDVLRGLSNIPPETTFPILYPKSEGRIWTLSYSGGELPNPWSSCPGYGMDGRSGPPIMIQIGSGDQTPNVSATSFTQGSTPLDHCVFDETNYYNPYPIDQDLGRSVLNTRDAIVIMPRSPLVDGQIYSVNVNVNGAVYSWSFTATTSPFRSQPLYEETVQIH